MQTSNVREEFARDVKTAIRKGDADTLRRLLDEDPSRANELVSWGKDDRILTHPLHYVSDMLFEGILQDGQEPPLVNALIQAGADLNFQRNGKGDTPLIGAASLGAEEVGLKLVQAGARPEPRGFFGETALHWASLLGEERLVKALLDGSDLELKDEKYKSPPLGWAIHGWENPPSGNRGRQREAIAVLLAAGAGVDPGWLESAKVRADPEIFAALSARR